MHTLISEKSTFESICSNFRPQPYRFIHKALRKLLCNALLEVGALDVAIDAERVKLVSVINHILGICTDHLNHENKFYHEPLHAIASKVVSPFYNEHLEHLLVIEELRSLLGKICDASPDSQARAYELYLRFSNFVAENLVHMVEEETTLTAALWANFTDDEINGFGDDLRAALSEAESGFYLYWMAKSLNHSELSTIMLEIKSSAPLPVFEQILQMVLNEITADRVLALNAVLFVNDQEIGQT